MHTEPCTDGLGDTAKAAFVWCEGGLRSPGRARLSHLGSLCLIFSVNVRHSPGVKIKLGPSGFLESRTAWLPRGIPAISTQSPPLPLL